MNRQDVFPGQHITLMIKSQIGMIPVTFEVLKVSSNGTYLIWYHDTMLAARWSHSGWRVSASTCLSDVEFVEVWQGVSSDEEVACVAMEENVTERVCTPYGYAAH